MSAENELSALERLEMLERQSLMLSQIAALVESWCTHESMTTLDGVQLALCELEELRAKERRRQILGRFGE